MGQSVVVDLTPVTTDEGTHEEQERRLWLMEVRNKHTDDLIVVTRTDDDLSAGMKDLMAPGIHPIGKSL